MLAFYLYACLALFVVLVCVGLYEDVTGKYDKKFGPNLKSGMFWFMVLAFSTPVHLLLFVGIVYRMIKGDK